MTAQICDKFIFKGEGYGLIGMQGGPLIAPEQFGMNPTMMGTSCYRGFYVCYELTEDGLYLRGMTLREADNNYLPIDSVLPEKDDDYDFSYHNLNVPVPFTGQIRLAKDIIWDLVINMGFHNPTTFRTVYDITLENGKIIDVKDRSREMEKKRSPIRRSYRKLIQIIRRENQITQAFSLDMDKE